MRSKCVYVCGREREREGGGKVCVLRVGQIFSFAFVKTGQNKNSGCTMYGRGNFFPIEISIPQVDSQ